MSAHDASWWSRVRPLLEEALELDPADRPAYLDRVCGEDAALRRDVEDYLRADDDLSDESRPSSVLHGSADEYAGVLLGADAVEATPDAPSRAPGERIGGYTIVRVRGAGAMGVVYEAEQDTPRRRVALKILRRARGGDDPLRTFRREVQSLARLRHPGIAAIYETGRTESGENFFAMELVDGVPLDEAVPSDAVRTRADLRTRATLFLSLADAIGYAHQRGVLHRDLKPSNVLVTTDGAAVQPKVLDFGLARLTGDDPTLATLRTDARTIKGTLTHMSPEQARGDADAVDVRSDVYALGVILYRLLTGALPYDLRDVPLPQAVRVICDTAPRSPSEASRILRGDVETVMLTALEKDPTRRYSSVAGFAADLRRALDGFPIQARPASAWSQLRALALRHRAATALAAGLVLVLLLGVVGTSAGLVRARKAERNAEAAAAAAREEAATAEGVTSFLEDVFRVSDPARARGAAVTARELLDTGVSNIQKNLADQPAVQARLLVTMGTVYRHLGLYAQSRPLLAQSLDIRRRLLGESHPDVAASEYALAVILRRQGEFDSARTLYERALATRTLRLGASHVDVGRTQMGLGNLHLDTGDYTRARAMYQKALPVLERALGPSDGTVGTLLGNLALTEHMMGDDAAARPIIERVLRIHENTFGRDHPEVGADCSIYGEILSGLGLHDSALVVLRRGLAIQETALGPDHTDVAETLNSLGNVLLAQKRYAPAREHFTRALTIVRAALGPRDPTVGIVADNIAEAQAGLGDLAGAIRTGESALGILQETLGESNDNTARSLFHVGRYLERAGDRRRAIAYYERAVAAYTRSLGPADEHVTEVLRALAAAERADGRAAAAAAHAARADSLDHARGT